MSNIFMYLMHLRDLQNHLTLEQDFKNVYKNIDFKFKH